MGTAVGIVGIAVALGWLGERQAATKRLTQEQVSCLIESQHALRELGLFPPTERLRDAGEVLNPLIGVDFLAPADRVPAWAEPRKRDGPHRDAWLNDPEQAPRGDLSFLAQLADYDHLDTRSSGAFGRHVASGASLYLPTSSHPTELALQKAAKARIAEGLRSGEVLPALHDVRALARILATDEDSMSPVFAVSVLTIERKGYEAAVGRGLLDAGAWSPVSKQDATRMRLGVLALAELLAGAGTAQDYATLQEAGGMAYGRCAAVGAAITARNSRRILTAERWPLEPDWAWMDEALDAAIEEGGCAFLAGDSWRQEETLSAEELFPIAFESRSPALEAILKMPYLRTWALPFAFGQFGIGLPVDQQARELCSAG